jgi:hypothetical protein
MLVNEFISNLLNTLGLAVPRIRDSMVKLHIQFELQNDLVFHLLNYFIMLQPEYKYNWNLLENNISNDNYKQISEMSQYLDLQMYLVSKQLLDSNEVIWLDDTIHQVLIDS